MLFKFKDINFGHGLIALSLAVSVFAITRCKEKSYELEIQYRSAQYDYNKFLIENKLQPKPIGNDIHVADEE